MSEFIDKNVLLGRLKSEMESREQVIVGLENRGATGDMLALEYSQIQTIWAVYQIIESQKAIDPDMLIDLFAG